MKKSNPKIIIALFSVIIGIFIATQMKLNVDLYVPATLKSIQNMKDEINAINNELVEMEALIEQKEKDLEILENISLGNENIIDILEQDLEINKIRAGKTPLEGPGIVIKMYDNMDDEIVGFDINDDIIHDIDILNILNDLKLAGAECISVNDQRVVSTSEIKCRGPVMGINGKVIGIPFIIKAIGDPKLLMASVNAPGTYGDVLKNVYFVGFEPSIEDNVVIPGYTGDLRFNFAKPVGEED